MYQVLKGGPINIKDGKWYNKHARIQANIKLMLVKVLKEICINNIFWKIVKEQRMCFKGQTYTTPQT